MRASPHYAERCGPVMTETVALLVRHGASDDSNDVDRFIGACRRADRAAAEQLLAEHPDLPVRLADEDRAAVVAAAVTAPPAAVALMLDLGFSALDRNGFGEQPLHSAAYHGNAEMARLLIDAGADVDARDSRFESTPLAFATVGSGESAGRPGNWVETVRLLIDAGASRDGCVDLGKTTQRSRSPPFSEALASPPTSPSPTATRGRTCRARSVPGSRPT